MSENIYSMEFKCLEYEQRQRHFEKMKQDSMHILQTIPLKKAEILGEAMGLMEAEMNKAKASDSSSQRLANNLLEDYTHMKRHAEMLEWFIRDIRRLKVSEEVKEVLKEYEEYRNKRNNEQLEK